MKKSHLPLPGAFKMVESVFAVERDGTRPQTVRRSWRERLFIVNPWRPWVATKIIQVPNYKPAIFRIGNQVVYHPALKDALMKVGSRE